MERATLHRHAYMSCFAVGLASIIVVGKLSAEYPALNAIIFSLGGMMIVFGFVLGYFTEARVYFQRRGHAEPDAGNLVIWPFMRLTPMWRRLVRCDPATLKLSHAYNPWVGFSYTITTAAKEEVDWIPEREIRALLGKRFDDYVAGINEADERTKFDRAFQSTFGVTPEELDDDN